MGGRLFLCREQRPFSWMRRRAQPALTRMAHEIVERNPDQPKLLAFVGIRTHGVPLARRLAMKVGQFCNAKFQPANSISPCIAMTLRRVALKSLGHRILHLM